jgi:hypothetical protein
VEGRGRKTGMDGEMGRRVKRSRSDFWREMHKNQSNACLYGQSGRESVLIEIRKEEDQGGREF